MPDESTTPELRVLRQLVEALLFEGIARSSLQFQAPGGLCREIHFSVGPHVYSCDARVGAFGRVRVAESSIRRVDAAGARGVHWEELAGALPAPVSVRAEIIQELGNTARFCRLNREVFAVGADSRREHSYQELESSLHEGHLYHPCFKARTGFSVEDNTRYGPEARRGFELIWLAIRRAELKEVLPCDECAFWTVELGEDAWAGLRHKMSGAGAPFGEYGLMPCHPWQWRHLERVAVAAMSRRELVPLGAGGGQYRATQSMRTLMHADDPGRAHVKLPLATRISSSSRLLAPECVNAAPAISSWLKQLVDSDEFFSEVASVIVLAEYAGSSYPPKSADSESFSGQFGVIWRESVVRHLGAGRAAVPFNALSLWEGDGRPFIDDWVSRYGLTRWITRLIQVSVLPLWRLLVHHGVALEAHAQNMILVHTNGWPESVALRDFHDSLEYVEAFLAEPLRAPRFGDLDARFIGAPPDHYYWMSSLEELRELFMDALFVFNLSELSWLLERSYGFSEVRFWGLVSRVLETYAGSVWGDERRTATLGHAAEFVRVESLFERRLRGASESGFHHWVPNPLHPLPKGNPCSTSSPLSQSMTLPITHGTSRSATDTSKRSRT